jgi:hypothetical protein
LTSPIAHVELDDPTERVLTIDTNKLEDMKLLEDVKATEKVALSRPAAVGAILGADALISKT